MRSHCGFDFPNENDIDFLFMNLFAICIYSLVRCVLKSLAHFLTGLFSYCCFKSSLYILYNSSLSDVSFANIFFPSVACLSLSQHCYFSEQKFLILMKCNLSKIYFVALAFDFIFKKSLSNARLLRLSPML